MQVLPNQKIFLKASSLFQHKLKSTGNSEINEFNEYMTGQYLSERSYGWYEGHAIGVPSNSNSIESTHKHMKTDPDLTSKKSLRHFLGSVEKGLIYNWSMNYNPDGNPNVKVFSTMPTINTTHLVNAYKWNQRKKK